MIALGCDHAGVKLKNFILNYFKENNIPYIDFGHFDETSTDYPIYAEEVCNAVLSNKCEKGILICGTGIGMSIAANRHKGIRCALCGDVFSAKATREHNNANILALGARVVAEGLALEIVKAFLSTEFSNGENHVRRIELLEK